MTMDKQKVIVEEMLQQTSTVVPTLFVGLGGCGGDIIKRVREHLKARPDYEDRFKPLTKFAYVDTNINDLEQARAYCDDTFLISDFSKEEYAALASGKSFLDEDDHFTQWVPKTYRFRAGDTAGAGQIRIESRLGCYYTTKHTEFVPKLRRLVEALKSHDNGYRRLEPREVRVVIAYSVAGGTGSGSHLSIAYMLRDIVMEVGSPTIIGVAVMPTVFDGFVGINRDGTAANGYAALKETEHLMRLGAPEAASFPKDGIVFHYDGSAPSKTIVRTKPFDFLYLIDKPESFTVDNVPHAAGDALYLQLFTSLFKKQAGDYDNYTQHQRMLVPHDFADKGIQGFSTFYATFGAAVLLVPSDGIIDYCSRLAALDMLKSQFVRVPPGEECYLDLQSSDNFYTVWSRDPRRAGELVKEAEFARRADEQNQLIDDLFVRRIRLLANAEDRNRHPGDFKDVFRHGQWDNDFASDEGRRERRADLKPVDAGRSDHELQEHSLFQVVAKALTGVRTTEDAYLAANAELYKLALSAANEIINRRCTETQTDVAGMKMVKKTLLGSASSTYDGAEAKIKGNADGAWSSVRRTVDELFLNGKPGICMGVNSMMELMKTTEQSLVKRRYGALQLIEALAAVNTKDASDRFQLSDDCVKDADADPEQPTNNAFEELRAAVPKYVAYVLKTQAGKLRDRLRVFCDIQRDADKNFDQFSRGETDKCNKLIQQGGKLANAYALDVEALTMETGYRLWNFYYADQVREKVAALLMQQAHASLASAFGMGEDAGRKINADEALTSLFEGFRDKARKAIRPLVLGDATKENQKPLAILDAINLETEYRAIFKSHADQIKQSSDPFKEITSLLATQRALEKRDGANKLDLSKAENRDYVRDKFKRLYLEKAAYLNLYDESKDLQGGLRPDKFEGVAMTAAAAADEKLLDVITEAMGKKPKLATEEFYDDQMIVFYRAVLNVPLYVFGRMNHLKDQYTRFQGSRFRAKVLHTDQNWEHSLPNLDPDDAFRTHQQQMLDRNVLFFAALHADRLGQRLIRYHNEGYELRLLTKDPSSSASADLSDIVEYAPLGSSIGDAARQLPDVLQSRRQANLHYFAFRNQLIGGLLPEYVERAFHITKAWRQMYEDLNTKLVDRNVEKQRRIDDLDVALRAMRRAAKELANRLSDDLLNAGRFGDQIDTAGLDLQPSEAEAAINESIGYARDFLAWAASVLDEDGTASLRVSPDARLFGPLSPAARRRQENQVVPPMKPSFQGIPLPYPSAPVTAEGMADKA